MANACGLSYDLVMNDLNRQANEEQDTNYGYDKLAKGWV